MGSNLNVTHLVRVHHYKFFQYLRENQPGAANEVLLGPRGFALLMIGIGLTALILARKR